MTLHIRRITAADIPACGRIIKSAFDGIARAHNFPLDFVSPEMAMGVAEGFTNHPQIYGVLAEQDGRVVGSNFLDQRNAVSAVGPISVDPDAQAKGVGRRLMTAVLEHGRAAMGIRLVQDAFNTRSMSLYASLGFDVKEPLALMSGKTCSVPAADDEVRPLEDADLPACAELCRKVHGFDRTAELRDTNQMFGSQVLVRGGRVMAYLAAPGMWFLNHAVAQTEQDLRSLLVGASASGTSPLSFLLPTRQAGLFRWAIGEGLRVVKPMTLMSMGEYQEPRGAYLTSVGY
jgi:predicted N-acetyltransferase YhbS